MSKCGLAQWLPAVLFTVGILYAQGELATITGEVTDSAQSIMPNVLITVRNVDTNIKRTLETNAEGYFTVTNLTPGNYELIAEKEGFRSYHQTGIVLATGQELRSDLKLSVGSVTESVNVTAEVAPLNTENGMIKGAVVAQQEINEMPLNGRDFTELALFVPGVMAASKGEAGSAFAINGARPDNTNFLVDGIDDRNVRGAAAQLRPNIDSLQEFKMEVSGFSAEYGKMAGGILNMVLKSGTNSYHGALFEYFRNDVFDSRAYFDTSRLPFHQNQWGGVISGPLSIPKVYKGKDRTFFMFSWESLRNPYGQTALGNVPTALERTGNFSQDVNNTGKPIVISNPLSSPAAPFPGNIIPASLISPVAMRIMQFYPLPNRTNPGNNVTTTANIRNTFDAIVTRGDHRFSEKDSISITYGKRFGRSNQPYETNMYLGLFDVPIRDDRELGGMSYTHMFKPTLLSETRFGLSRNATRDSLKPGFPTAAQIGMTGSTTDPALLGFPLVNVTGYLQVGYPNNEPVQYFVTNYGVRETLTWIKGDHVFKWGVDSSRNRFNQPYFNNERGTMTASGIWSGNRVATNGDAIADLEMGLLASSSITLQPANNYMRNRENAFFFTDDWKISHSLTLNLGMRYEIDSPPSDLYGRMTNFIPQYGQIVVSNPANIPNYAREVATVPGNLIVPRSQYNLPPSLIQTDYRGFAPRVGFAWRPFGSEKTVLRGGYGIFYSGELLNDVRNALDNVFPNVIAPSFTNVAANPNALTLSSPWPGGLATLGTTANGYQSNPSNPYLQSYNLTVEREIGHGAIFEAAFVGSKGTHLGVRSNINQPYRNIAAYLQSGVFTYPYGAQFATINYWSFNTNSIYNSGQFTLRNRGNGRFFYHLSYSYSKSMDIASQFSPAGVNASLGGDIEDPRNFKLSRARSDFDRGHLVQAVFSYSLPVGQNQKFLSRSGKLVNGFIGGWRLAGTTIFETGPPMTIEDSSVNTAIGQNLYPNRIANGALRNGVGRRGVDYPWFNPAVFQPVPGCIAKTATAAASCPPDQYGFLPFADGNSGRNILDAPGLQNINLSLQKNWLVTESKTLQFRWEVFNIFNHPNFVLMDRNFNETGAGYLSSVADVGTGGARIMQFGLKFLF